jgi:hypothetical protein
MAIASLDLALLFNLANLYVLPFWLLMIVVPRWQWTRRVIHSLLPFVPLAGLYAYLFVTSLTPDTAESFANPTLADVARLFGDERVALTGWVHFLVMDLLAGRWIYQEGQRLGVWTIHSLILCLFAGPLGLLSHIVTRSLQMRGQDSEPGLEAESSEAKAT